ncbi:MAG TPA: rhomboid family intramembrane serine protease [Catalimonadaceae bacterium]|nr:rhomboid family intramembrane serine protease [Catalimonadaceae bacterium]
MTVGSNSTLSASQVVKKGFLYSLLPSLLFSTIMILVKVTEVVSQTSLARYGLKPRIPLKLYGIITFPFLHGDWLHLFSNLLPFIFLSTLIVNLFPRIFPKIFLLTFFLSGFWTWCFARDGTVIGASGWVYSLLGFLLVAGFSKSSRKTMVIAGGLAFLYGGMVEGLVPYRPHISWEGHLMGLVAGIVAAIYWRKEIKASDLNPINDRKIMPAGPEQPPPYPFWLYNEAHLIDAQRRIIHPDDVVWENGRPFLKPAEMEEVNPDEATPESDPKIKSEQGSGIQPVRHHTGGPATGFWNFTQT